MGGGGGLNKRVGKAEYIKTGRCRFREKLRVRLRVKVQECQP